MAKFSILATALTLGFVLPQGHAQGYSLLYSFPNNYYTSDFGTIAQTPGGNLLFGMLSTDVGDGRVFEVGLGGGFKGIYTFNGADGAGPSGLTVGTDQWFHGATIVGGKNNHGMVYRLSPDGKLIVQHNFAGGKDGERPESAPIQGSNGIWYGVTEGTGGKVEKGSIYTIAPGGNYTLLHSFTGADGSEPNGSLVEGSDGLFYGTTRFGGTQNYGTIFTISPSGTFNVLYNFDGAHGRSAFGPLIQASDGNFYGLAAAGGTSDNGVAFRITPSGTYTVLHNFTGANGGTEEWGALVEATDGYLYGTSMFGGTNNWGVLYRLTKAGDFTVIYNFPDSGGEPPSHLLQHTNGKLYGYQEYGGTQGMGGIYQYDLGLAPFVSYLPVYGQPGAKVTILGQDFQNNSIVSFNGTQAQQVNIHPTYLTAVVPDGATTGPITVQTSKNGQTLTFTSNKPFVVH